MRTRFRLSAVGLCLVSLVAFLFFADSARAGRGHGRIAVPHEAGLAPSEGHGHVGEEIEGKVTAVDTTGGTLTIQDERLGSVVVTVDDNTIIRHGWQPVALADVKIGAQVHVKAAPQDGGGFLAAAIFVQNNGNGSGGGQGSSGTECDTEVEGTVSAIDCGAGTMTVTTDSGDVGVTFDTNTVFFTKGHTASTCDQIQTGDTVEVCGTQGDTSVLAAKVKFEAPEAPETCEDEVSGAVSAIDCGANTMTVTTDSGDVNVTLADTTTYFGPHHADATCDDIAVGDAVEVEGTLQDDGSIAACKVSFEPPEVEETEVSGTINGAPDSGTQSFILTTDSGDVTIDTDSSTVIKQDGDIKTFADLADQMQVEVEGILQADGSILASRISIESGDGD